MKKIIFFTILITFIITSNVFAIDYHSQFNTGEASLNNCGPASVKIATGTSKSVEDIRNDIPNDNGWWWTYDIEYWLYSNGYNYTIKSLDSDEQLRNDINNPNQTIIACIDLYYMYPFHHTHNGHFVVLESAETTQYNWLVTVYDPWYGIINTEKSNVNMAMSTWWDYYIVVYN